jgi:hypothetical protein
MPKLLKLSDFGLTDKDVTAQKRIEPMAALAIIEGRVVGTERMDCYVYRISPKRSFLPKGTPGYFARLDTPKPFDDLKKEIGGGQFRFIGNSYSDKDEANGQRKTLVDFVFEIDAPPLEEKSQPAPASAAPTGSSPLVDGNAALSRHLPSQGKMLDDGEELFLRRLKLYKEIFTPNGGGHTGELDAFLKGVQFVREMRGDEKKVGSTGWDALKDVLTLVREEAARRPWPSPPRPAPAPAGQAHVEPPAVAIAGEEVKADSLPHPEALFEYLMDSFDEGKASRQTAEEVVSMIPKDGLKNLFAFTDESLVAMVENGSRGFEGDWLAEKPAEKRAWLAETVRVARSLIPAG